MRRPLAAALALAALTAVSGCGIRTTEVPVDAGAAPSRVSCHAPEPTTPSGAADSMAVGVYLVCSQQAAVVRRILAVRPQTTPRADRTALARLLLGQLQHNPSVPETDAGFSTEVPGNLEVTGPLREDPPNALRLSQPPAELPAFALAQIVCTFTGSAASEDGLTVMLGGSDAEPVKRYACTPELRTEPTAADSAGTAVG